MSKCCRETKKADGAEANASSSHAASHSLCRECFNPTEASQLMDSIKKSFLIVGAALLIFAAIRNSITWHLQQFWGASGDFWQNQWEKVYDLFGGNAFLLLTVGTHSLTFGVFWFFNSLFLLLDVTGKPAFLLKYKIQDGANVPMDMKRLRSAILRVLFNQLVVGSVFGVLVYPLYVWRGVDTSRELPTFHWVLLELVVHILVEEVGFYYSHRLLHHPRLYKHIHKIHHEWTAPIGITALYAHPIEHICSNIGPPMLGPLIMGSHIATAWLWFCMAILSTTISHSGYHFPLVPSPEAHDFHHLKFTNNFGVLGVLDRLHGTDTMFRNSRQYERHILFISAIPIHHQYPDSGVKQIKPE